MAYKYAKGKVYRGDIYNEDDTQRNTFIDFSEDAVGIIVGNAEGLVVSGSGAVSSSLNVSASGFYGDGSGLSNVTATSSPAGSDGQLQYNNGGSTGGAASLYWRDDNNRLGIGTGNPSKDLDIEGASSAMIQFNATNHRAYNVGSDGYGFVIHDASTGGTAGYRFVISDQAVALGYVGIGAGASIAGNNHPDALLHLSSSDDGQIFRADATNGTTVLFATGSNRVGIGTNDPSATFHAYGSVSSDYIGLIDNDASSNAHGLKVTTDGNGSGTNVLDLESGTTTLFRVRGDGRVGIGKVTSLPSACLTVSGSNGDADIAIASKLQHIGDSNTYLEFATDIIDLVAGGKSMIKMEENAGQITVNNASNEIEFRVLDHAGETFFTAHGSKSTVGIHNDNPDASYDLVVGQDVFIVSGSSVGIGSTWSGKELHVTDGNSNTPSAPADSQVVVESGGNAGISLLSAGSRARIYFGDDSDIDEGIIEYKFTNSERFNITVNANEVMRIYESGASNTITTLNGVKTTAGLFTEGHPYYSNDANITVGDCCVLENGQIVRSSSPMQKNVGGIAWYSVLDDLQNPGLSGDDAWPLTLDDNTVSRVAEDALGVQCNMAEESGAEWVPTAKFQTLWKLAAIGDSRQSNYGTTALAGFKVCNEGGEISAGDLLCTSATPGYLMKQSDDIMRSYTVGKAMEAVTFDSNGQATGIYGYLYCG